MKLTVSQIDGDGNLLRSQNVPITQAGDEPVTVTDAPIEVGSEGTRYLFVHYTPTSGKLTFSLRRKPLLGHRSYYGNLVEFDAYLELKGLPASFLCRVGPELLLQINLEATSGRKGVKLCTLHWTRRGVARRTEGCRENLGWNLRARFTT